MTKTELKTNRRINAYKNKVKQRLQAFIEALKQASIE